MKGRSWRATTLLAAALAVAVLPARGQEQTGTSLVVLIVVDQLRADLLERYGPALEGGLRRFADEGFTFSQASHAHGVTHTAAGHATISTGTFPSRSGIVANSWQQRSGGLWVNMYCVQDDDAPLLGFETTVGRSPRNMLRTGLADWILAADAEARVVSIAGKDRSAITMAGKTRGHAYWLVEGLGRFVTSRHYRDSYPPWVEAFNQEVMPGIMADTVWDSWVPREHRGLARPDSAVYEYDGVNTTFPHLASAETNVGQQRRFYSWGHQQPRSDAAVLALATRALNELELGRRGSVDFLAIGLSAADYVGHSFGPMSQEQLDNLFRLDRGLEAFLDYLDMQVGEGRWVAALTGDHGAMTMPEYLRQLGDEGAVRTSGTVRTNELSDALLEVAARNPVQPGLSEGLARLLERRGVVARAYTHRELTVGQPADSFATLYRNSHYPGRAHSSLSPYGVEVRWGFHELVHVETGTTHGSPYWYDRHVPFMLLGTGVTHGSTDEAVYTVDVAPTLARLVGVSTPDDLNGRAVNR